VNLYDARLFSPYSFGEEILVWANSAQAKRSLRLPLNATWKSSEEVRVLIDRPSLSPSRLLKKGTGEEKETFFCSFFRPSLLLSPKEEQAQVTRSHHPSLPPSLPPYLLSMKQQPAMPYLEI